MMRFILATGNFVRTSIPWNDVGPGGTARSAAPAVTASPFDLRFFVPRVPPRLDWPPGAKLWSSESSEPADLRRRGRGMARVGAMLAV